MLALVPRSSSSEDVDFDERFRRDRVRRLVRGVRRGISPSSLIRYRFGGDDRLVFHGVAVDASDMAVTCRVIEDIWLRGEYDLPGFIPQAGWRVIDVGANVGIFAMLAASRGAEVVSYEPHPEAFERLRVNTARWHVECHQAAVVGQGSRSVRLFLDPGKDTRGTLVGPEKADADVRQIDVPAVPIERVLRLPCDLLKVDCEGGEFEIFEHAGDSLQTAARIIVEVHEEAGDALRLMRVVHESGFDVELHEAFPGMPFRLLMATS